jgi:hypothetical protein
VDLRERERRNGERIEISENAAKFVYLMSVYKADTSND